MLFGKSKQKTNISLSGKKYDDFDSGDYFIDSFEEDFKKVMADIKATKENVEDLTSNYIKELKQEIKDLKTELRADRQMLWAILNKFADKPAALTASQAWLANKQQQSNSSGGFAAMDKTATATSAKK